MSLRKLKFHEHKLLKKVDFLQWKSDQVRQHERTRDEARCGGLGWSAQPAPAGRHGSLIFLLLCSLLSLSLSSSLLLFVFQNIREVKVLRRYHIQVREDYVKYNRMVGQVHQIVHKLTKLPADDEYRVRTAEQMMNKLSDAGQTRTLARTERTSGHTAAAQWLTALHSHRACVCVCLQLQHGPDSF